jgi:uncharacterized alpha-E superfamily protein
MLSRVADSLYWMSRYLERANHTARLIDVNLYLTLDQEPASAGPRWYRLQASLMPAPSDVGGVDPSATARAIAFELMTQASFASWLDAARQNARAIIACLSAARENARHIRECIGSEMWEQINRLYLWTRNANLDDIWHQQPHDFFRHVQEGAHLFQGISDGTMCHDEGWHFTQLGMYIERASATAALLDVQSGALIDAPRRPEREQYLEWVGLLRSCMAFEAFCKAYSAELRPESVLEFLMLDREFPHALMFSVERVQQSMLRIAEATGNHSPRAERLAGRLVASLQYHSIEEILASGLHIFLGDIQNQCARIQEAIHHTYVESHMAAAPGA